MFVPMNCIDAYTLSGHFCSNMLLYGCGVSAFSVGQLTVGWRDGKARERGLVCASVRKGFIDASQLAYNNLVCAT